MNAQIPKYQKLGLQLRIVRLNTGRSMQNVADFLNLDRSLISKFENGRERPTEESLNLLISYFSLNRSKALTLWGLAGYKTGLVFASPRKDGINMDQTIEPATNPLAQTPGLNFNIDAASKPAIYSDMALVNSSEVGLMIDFAQSVGPTGQFIVQTRVGMSKDQARKLIDALKGNLGIE